MARTTIAFGTLLIGLGLAGYYRSGGASWTALIPAIFGLVLAAFGAIGLNEGRRKHAMHGAAAVGTLGLLATLPGVFKLFALMAGRPVDRPAAVVVQAIMALILAVFVWLCVQSFREARRRRRES